MLGKGPLCCVPFSWSGANTLECLGEHLIQTRSQ